MKPAAVADLNRIEVNPDVMLGKPVGRETRIPVHLIVDSVESGHTPAEIVDDYPDLTVDDIAAALAYAEAERARTARCSHPAVGLSTWD